MEKLLTIAGTDPSGGAGIQADLKTFAAHKTYGMSVITSVVAQNTTGVKNVVDLPPEFIGEQMDSVFTDIFPDAVKIGMISNERIIKVIVERLKKYKAKDIVVDPVMVATSGNSLIKSTAVKALIGQLLPLADVVTPNIPEAEVLSGIEIKNKKDMEEVARVIGNSIKAAVLVKGGHLEDCADDLLYMDGKIHWLQGEKIDNPNTHGTGCTLSSAIAVNLAKGMNILEAVEKSKDYLTGAIRMGLDLGEGRGPLDHLYNISI